MNDFLLVVAISLAGGVGSALRHLSDNALPERMRARHPWGTTVVNIVGSYALGLLTGLGLDGPGESVLTIGLLGGYTTFSTASLETLRLLTDRRWAAAAAHGLGLILVCVAAAVLGILSTRP